MTSRCSSFVSQIKIYSFLTSPFDVAFTLVIFLQGSDHNVPDSTVVEAGLLHNRVESSEPQTSPAAKVPSILPLHPEGGEADVH